MCRDFIAPGNAPELATQVVETGKPLLVLAESAR
jgi:hypothetical protein